MNRIDTVLNHLKTQQKKMLSPYITAGDPDLTTTLELMHALVAGGADILELGIPFSDPMAEGPVIQAAMERALAKGVTCQQVLDLVKKFRTRDTKTPIVLMGYVNPIEYYGYERFAKDAQLAGVDGTILVDLPPEESESIQALWDKYELYSIYLCSPTTSKQRMELINRHARGYLYFVSLKGVTGSNAFNLEVVKKQYLERKSQTPHPLMLGFGIKTAEMAAQVAAFADGVIVGAALIEQLFQAQQTQQDMMRCATSFIHEMHATMNNNNG